MIVTNDEERNAMGHFGVGGKGKLRIGRMREDLTYAIDISLQLQKETVMPGHTFVNYVYPIYFKEENNGRTLATEPKFKSSSPYLAL